MSSASYNDKIYLEPSRKGIKLYTTILTDGTQQDGTFPPPLSATLPAGTTHPKAYPNNTDVEILPIKRTDNKQPGFSLVKVGEDVAGYIRTMHLLRTGAALRAAAGHASGAAAAVAAVDVSLSTADPSRLLKLNTPPFLIDGDQTNAILVMVHTLSPGAQILNENGTPRGLYYPNRSELRLVESRVSSGTETGQAGTATSTRLVQIDDRANGDGWLPMGCLLRTTVRNEFDIDRFWMRASAELDQNVVNSAGKVLGTVAEARLAHDGLGFDFGRYGNDYELFRNEYMPHILRPNEPVVPWVRGEGREGSGGGTRRRKGKKGKKSRASRSSRRQLRRRCSRTRHRHRR